MAESVSQMRSIASFSTRSVAYLAAAAVGIAAAEWIDEVRPEPPSLAFLGPAVPQIVQPGQRLPVEYNDVLRRTACGADVVVRWRSVEGGEPGAIIAGKHEEFRAGLANAGTEPVNFKGLLPIRAPEEIGRYFYHPIMKPDLSCGNTDPIIPPPMLVIVKEKKHEK